MKLDRAITFLGGPLDGQLYSVEHAEVGHRIVIPMLNRMDFHAAAEDPIPDAPLFRRGFYVLRWVRDDFVGVWEGEKD